MTLVNESLDTDVYEPDYRVTASRGHAGIIVEEGLEEGVRYFVAVGGDGTINEVAVPLIGKDAAMGVIPSGSGNGLARHLMIPVKISEAVEVLNAGKLIEIDTCSVNNIPFISIAGIGFDAKVARKFAKTKQRGFKTYARLAMKEYFRYKSRKYKLILDGEERKESAFFISFANSNQFGYNAIIAPNASITDGKIDVCIVSRPPLKAFPGIARMMFRREIDRSKYLETIRATEVLVKRQKGKTVNIDGEPIKMGKNLFVKIHPASLKVIVP